MALNERAPQEGKIDIDDAAKGVLRKLASGAFGRFGWFGQLALVGDVFLSLGLTLL